MVRLLRCEASKCARQILAERFPTEILPAFARCTARLVQVVHHLGLALGGRFGLLTERAIQRGVHCSVAELERDIRAFIEATNADPKPLRWVKSADAILASVKRFCLRAIEAELETTPLPRTSDAGY